ncbi:hypothetical protein C922_02829 [Plasmodium inui San Antonio 1]|uniref:EGF-like domain-containing protein n=1 Tax=Plasmodium inui San Antonio 1 TaxID=1237626 RepID=W7ACM1_9APIC|nr:hypothetical protein C922_02829 [Plasmodium inui San Antonio 1]EUD66844.1 hypothetical protein C922_02829 [Plasmodium inui San Antonio 1]
MKVAYFLSALDFLIIFSLYLGGTCSGFAGIVACMRHGRILDEAGQEGVGGSGNVTDATNATTNAATDATTEAATDTSTTAATNGDASGGLNSPAESSGSGGNDPANPATHSSDLPTTGAQNTPPGNGGQTGDHDAEVEDGDYDDTEDDTRYNLQDVEEIIDPCSENNGGCGDDKICENLGEGIVKCSCKPGYKLVDTECVESSKSSSWNSFFCWFLLLIIVLASIN